MKNLVYAAGLLSVALTLTATREAVARRPRWGGHGAVAVSPDGKTVAVGGVGRTLYLVDAADRQVVRRHWHGAQIGALAFNADGSVLVLEDETSTVTLLDSQSLEPRKTLKNTDFISMSEARDRMAALTDRNRKLTIFSTADGTSQLAMDLPEGFHSVVHALHPDGNRAALLGRAFDQPLPEGTETPADLPKEHARLFQDGKASRMLIYDTRSGEQLADHTLWYTSQGSDNMSLSFRGRDVVVFTYNAVNIVVDEQGNIRPLESLPRFGYGRAASADHTRLATGSLAAGVVGVWTPDGLQTTKFALKDRLRGWPEYFADFAFAPDGQSVYGVTSAFRLIHIRHDGSIVSSTPVY